MNSTQALADILEETASLLSSTSWSINYVITGLAILVAISSLFSAGGIIYYSRQMKKSFDQQVKDKLPKLLENYLEDEENAESFIETIFDNYYIQSRLNDLIEGQVSVRLDHDSTDEGVSSLSKDVSGLSSRQGDTGHEEES